MSVARLPTKRVLVGAAIVGVVGCSSDESGSGSAGVPNQLNECATKGATYFAHHEERPGGTCGQVPDQVVNTDDPGITASTCASVTQENCVARGTSCKSFEKGCEITLTYMTKFTADGSSATSVGTYNISCSDGSYCTSTYDVTMTRQ